MICSIISTIVLVFSTLVFIPFYMLKVLVIGLIGILAGLVACNLPKTFPYEIKKRDKDEK